MSCHINTCLSKPSDPWNFPNIGQRRFRANLNEWATTDSLVWHRLLQLLSFAIPKTFGLIWKLPKRQHPKSWQPKPAKPTSDPFYSRFRDLGLGVKLTNECRGVYTGVVGSSWLGSDAAVCSSVWVRMFSINEVLVLQGLRIPTESRCAERP